MHPLKRWILWAIMACMALSTLASLAHAASSLSLQNLENERLQVARLIKQQPTRQARMQTLLQYAGSLHQRLDVEAELPADQRSDAYYRGIDIETSVDELTHIDCSKLQNQIRFEQHSMVDNDEARMTGDQQQLLQMAVSLCTN